MTLEELSRETLVEKHVRLKQEKCPHEKIYSSTVYEPNWMFQEERTSRDRTEEEDQESQIHRSQADQKRKTVLG